MNNTGFRSIPNRNYLALEPRNEAERLKLEKKLNIFPQLIELSTKAAQKSAQRPGTETCDTVTVRCLECGEVIIGAVFTVGANGNDFDRYALYLCPTMSDYYALEADFRRIAEETGFVASTK